LPVENNPEIGKMNNSAFPKHKANRDFSVHRAAEHWPLPQDGNRSKKRAH